MIAMKNSFQKPAWRHYKFDGNGSIKPKINNFPADFIRSSLGKRFVLACSDIDYLRSNIKSLISHEQSKCPLPLLIGIYLPFDELSLSESYINSIKALYSFKKTYFFIFYSERLSYVVKNLSGNDSEWDYQINYIRCARFILLTQIWQLNCLNLTGYTIKGAAAYITDLDTLTYGDYDQKVLKEFGDKSIILSWDGNKSPNKKFPIDLLGSSWVVNSNNKLCRHQLPSRIIKAGFSCFSPSKLSTYFLEIFEDCSIGRHGLEVEPLHMRLFNYYYGDQLSMIHSLHEIKSLFHLEYRDSIAWMDISKSSIANLSLEFSPDIYLLKGDKSKP